MTNEEKAREIYFGMVGKDTTIDALMKMATWKDKEFEEWLGEFLEDILFECQGEYHVAFDNDEITDVYKLKDHLLELFKTEYKK